MKEVKQECVKFVVIMVMTIITFSDVQWLTFSLFLFLKVFLIIIKSKDNHKNIN